jgi:hypothetical protein
MQVDRRIEEITDFISRFDITDLEATSVPFAESLGLAFYPAANADSPIENELLYLNSSIVNIYNANYSTVYVNNFLNIRCSLPMVISSPTYVSTEFTFNAYTNINGVQQITYQNNVYTRVITPSLVGSNTFLYNTPAYKALCLL